MSGLWVCMAIGRLESAPREAVLLRAWPRSIYSGEKTKITFMVQCLDPQRRAPDHVVLRRLQGNGGYLDTANLKRDNTLRGEVPGADMFSAVVPLKEKTGGILSFYTVVSFPGAQFSFSSPPLFITVVGGFSSFELKQTRRIQEQAEKRIQTLLKQTPSNAAWQDLFIWLKHQPHVVAIRSTPDRNLEVQFTTGIVRYLRMTPLQGSVPPVVS